MNIERLAPYVLEVIEDTGWAEEGSGILRKYDSSSEKRYEISQLRMSQSGLSETDISLQFKDEMGGWVDMMRLRIEEDEKDETNMGIQMRIVVETGRVDGEYWMPTYEFDEQGVRRVCDGRAMRNQWNLLRERELRGTMYNRFNMPFSIDFERTMDEFLMNMGRGEFRRPILFVRQ